MEKDIYDSSDAYAEHLQTAKATKVKRHCPDSSCFIPTPDEIKQRASDLGWLMEMGFGNRVIESVMQHDQPTIEWIERMVNVKKLSAAEITRRIRPFLICKDYREDEEPRR